MKKQNCCSRYTDNENKQCLLCGTYSKSNDDFQASIEYIKTKGELYDNRITRN